MKWQRRRSRAEPPRELVVELRRSGIELVVPPALTVLEAMERNGFAVPSMCRAGVCGACEHWPVDAEPASGHRGTTEPIRLCVTTARTVTRLVLDL